MVPNISLVSKKQNLYILPEGVEEVFAGLKTFHHEKKPDFQKLDIEATSVSMEL